MSLATTQPDLLSLSPSSRFEPTRCVRQDWSNPAPVPPEPCHLLIGEVDRYDEVKGYGFVLAAEGSFFFHASGFRQPRLWNDQTYAHPRREVQLADLSQRGEGRGATKPFRIPLPPLPPRTALLFELDQRRGKTLAHRWCLRDAYVPLLHQLQQEYAAAALAWQRAAIYRLTWHQRSYGPYYANNHLKRMVRDSQVRETVMFEGTNTEFLQGWYRNSRQQLRLNADSWLTLHYREFVVEISSHGDWQECPSEMMFDFLG